LDWELVPYSYNYKVYASENPYGFAADPTVTLYTNGTTLPAAGAKGFYKVTGNIYRDYSLRSQDMLRELLQANITVVEDEDPIGKKVNRDPQKRP